jgi:hypothetical protein
VFLRLFWRIFLDYTEILRKSLYNLIGNEETSTAVYILSLKLNKKFGYWILKAWVARNMWYWSFFLTNDLELLKKMQKYIYSDRSWRDKHGTMYMCSLKPNRMFGNWINRAWGAENMCFWGFLTNVLELSRKLMQKYIYSDRSWRDKHGSIYIHVVHNLIERSEIEF